MPPKRFWSTFILPALMVTVAVLFVHELLHAYFTQSVMILITGLVMLALSLWYVHYQGRVAAALQRQTDEINELARAQAALRESEALYRNLFESIDDAIIIHNLEGDIIVVNEATCRRLGYKREALLQMKVSEIDEPDFGAKFQDRLQHQLGVGHLRDIEGVHLTKDSIPIPVQINTTRIEYQGKPAIMGVSRDMTAVRQSEKALRESEARYRQLLETIRLPIAALDYQHNVLYCNEAYAEALGTQVKALEGKNLLALYPAAAQSDAHWTALHVLETGQFAELEDDILGRWMLMQFHPAPFGLLVVMYDVTERRAAEKQKLQAELERERTRVLGRFIQDASHEFRTPISTIQANLYLLHHIDHPTEREALLAKIDQQTVSILQLVDSLALMAELDSQTTFSFEIASIGRIIDQLYSKMMPLSSQKALNWTCNVEPDLPKVMVDGIKFEIALLKLVENAFQFTPSGGRVTIHAYLREDGVIIEVKDTGQGIPAKDLPHIFDRFYRGDSVHTTRGFGLGLPIAKNIVEAHLGTLEVTSTPAKGTVFSVKLPTMEQRMAALNS